MSFISVNHLTAGYGSRNVVEDLSFNLDSGCLMGVLGANGSGKTTMLKAVCGILPHKGECIVDGSHLEGLSARQVARLCGYIPQRSGISIDTSLLDVVLMGFNPYLGILEHPDKNMKESAMRALMQVGLAEKANMNYLHLSEGQKQLCILARTLVAGSRLLLLDEPESALDFSHRYKMLSLLQNWVTQTKNSAIVTLHDPMLALNYCDRLLLLKDGRLLGIIQPKVDDTERMEALLSNIYGKVSLQYVIAKNGVRQLIMLNEESL